MKKKIKKIKKNDKKSKMRGKQKKFEQFIKNMQTKGMSKNKVADEKK